MAYYTKGAFYDSSLSSTSRYSKSLVLYYTEEGKLTFPIYKRKPFRFGEGDKWYEIVPYYEYRPDLLSYDYYGSVDFWWRIMEANKMKDILEFKAGRNIRLPNRVLK